MGRIRFAAAADAPALLGIYGQYMDTPITFECALPSEEAFRGRVAEYGAACAADEIYACALVHDIGRARGGRNHALSSAEFAKELLPSCGFLPEETERIASAVSAHGGRGGAEVCPAPGAGEEDKIKAALEKAENPLGTLLVIADKLSRNCFNCAAEEECYWEKKNGRIWI